MQLLICMLLGASVAWALKKSNEQNDLGWLRPVTGALAASLPYTDYFLLMASINVQQAYMEGVFWSLIFAPLMAMGLAFSFSLFRRDYWDDLVKISLTSYLVSLLFALLSTKGIPIFAPFTYWHISLDILHPFDWGVFSLLILSALMCFFFKAWQRDIARISLVLLVVYVTCVVTFSTKAETFAKNYAQAFNLSVEKIYTLPQPLSPMNWRVIIETKNQRMHDTLINLRRENEKDLTKSKTRAAKIDGLYKPMSKAVWRVYHRFGRGDKVFARSAFVSLYQVSDQFKWLSRHWVASDVIMYNSHKCARFIDLRREGSRQSKNSLYMICKEKGGASLYRPLEDGTYILFEMMY